MNPWGGLLFPARFEIIRRAGLLKVIGNAHERHGKGAESGVVQFQQHVRRDHQIGEQPELEAERCVGDIVVRTRLTHIRMSRPRGQCRARLVAAFS